MYHPLSSSIDAGWNDPPLFPYESLRKTGTPRHFLLTKRPLHPQSDKDKSTVAMPPPPPIDVSGPPIGNNSTVLPPAHINITSGPPKGNRSAVPPPAHITVTSEPPKVTSGGSGSSSGEEERKDGGEEVSEQPPKDFTEVVHSLEGLVDQLPSSVQQRTSDEIRRRLGVLSRQWEEGGLSSHVQLEMTKLSTGSITGAHIISELIAAYILFFFCFFFPSVSALVEGDYSGANEIHVALMVDHIAEVTVKM